MDSFTHFLYFVTLKFVSSLSPLLNVVCVVICVCSVSDVEIGGFVGGSLKNRREAIKIYLWLILVFRNFELGMNDPEAKAAQNTYTQNYNPSQANSTPIECSFCCR